MSYIRINRRVGVIANCEKIYDILIVSEVIKSGYKFTDESWQLPPLYNSYDIIHRLSLTSVSNKTSRCHYCIVNTAARIPNS